MPEIERLPGETREDAKLRAQNEAQARLEAAKRATDEARRKLYTSWLFWKFCPHKSCRRACACIGDVERCHNRFWPIVPEEMKVEFRAAITARGQGMSLQETARHARKERNRYLEMEARFAREKAEREAAAAQRFDPPQPRTIPDHLAPRIRRL